MDTGSPEVLKFKWARGDHAEAVVGTDLPPEQGIAHQALADELTTANEDLEAVKDDLTHYYKHIYVKEVVREPKMHFWKVPRLGAFMAVPLVYNSALSEESFQRAYDDFNKYMEDLASIEQQKIAHAADQDQKRQAALEQGVEFEEEEKEWEEPVLPGI